MKIFINDIPVNIIRASDTIDLEHYEEVVEGRELAYVEDLKLKDDVLIRQASTDQIDKLLKFMKAKKLKKLDSITVTVNDHKSVKHFVKSKFKVIEAAGGIVRKGNNVLLIYRLGVWDLPKGKLEKKEAVIDGAVREVEEECNIKVRASEKICSTWHTYTHNGKRVLKKTTWYAMDCIEDKKMKPQAEEDIEEVRWMNPREVRLALHNSYPSIRYVFKRYYEMYAVEH